MTYVIIGNGPAGVSAIECIREIDSCGKIVLISKENNPPYSRIMTPEYMTAEVEEDKLYYRGTEFYERYKVETRLGSKVTNIIPSSKTVVLDSGETIEYDRLLIATGSRPLVPSWVNLSMKGVFTLWDKTDSEEIHAYLEQTREAVIIGGGLVGLQSARALCAQGINVTVIEKMERLMPLQLDEVASNLLLEAAKRHGINVYLGTEVLALESQDGKITGVKTKETIIAADLVIVAIGVRPNLDMVTETELEKDRCLLTNEYMETNIAGIYAAGDVVQTFCHLSEITTVRPLWLSAVQQGKIAGKNMAGEKERYPGSIALNSIQLFGLPIISQGQIETAHGVEATVVKHPRTGSYQKMFHRNGRLEGFILVGDVQEAGVLHYKLGKPLGVGYWGSLNNYFTLEDFVN